MTEPTDDEIAGCIRAANVRCVHPDAETTMEIARAVLARWGQPSGAGEAAEHYRNAIASACEGWTMPDGLRKHLETALWSPPTPQPTQMQAGAVPLTDEYPALVCDYCGALTPDPWHSSGMLHGKMSKHIHSCDACAARGAAQPQAGAVPLTDEQIKALMQAHRTAMLMTCKAKVPECGEFAAIAQDLDWLCESFGIKGGQHGTE